MELRSYRTWPKQREDFGTIVNSRSAGKAKAEYLADLNESWPEYDYTDIRCKVIGQPHTSEAFQGCADYRGEGFAYCGMRIALSSGNKGVIVGHNDSANFNILFYEGEYAGQTLNCHPNWEITYYDSDGNVIKSFVQSKAS